MRIEAVVLRLLVAVPLLLGLVACSGGGGGTPPPAPTYTVTGTIIAARGSAADWDVNDPYAPYQKGNDSCATAQPLPNPVTLGGYLNAPGAGAAGRSFADGDLDDFYRVSLQAGQTVTLYISEDDLDANDLDLYLWDGDCSDVVLSSAGIGATESVTATGAGDYVIQVAVYCDNSDNSGGCGDTASNYTLVIGQSAPAAAMADTVDSGAEFVPGEVIVRFAAGHQALSLEQADHRIQALGLARKAGGAPSRNMLLSLGDATERASALAALGVSKVPGQALKRHGIELSSEQQARLETVAAVRALRTRPEVASADLNYIRRALLVPNDPFYSYQWHYPQINLPAAWAKSTGSGVIVAVVDTGVLLNHPDLKEQLVDGYDFISDPTNAGDEDGINPDPDDPGDWILPDGRSSFHGTHVAGIVAARSNNETGVAGVAWGAQIMPLRVLGRFGGSSYDIQQAILFAAGLENDATGELLERRADIINLSLGGGGASSSEQDVYTRVRNWGVIIVAAAGNENSSVPSYPASYNGVISVSAVDINKQRAPYSNFGSEIDVAAPGGDISRDVNGDGYGDGVLSTVGDDGSGTIKMGYNFQQGTSMAAPHVAGVLALMKEVNSKLTPDDVDGLLEAGTLTEDLGDPEIYGYGLIDAAKAVQAAPNTPDPPDTPALLLANPASLNFSTDQNSLTLQLRNGGTAALTDVAVTDNADWLTVAKDSVDDEGLGRYKVTIDRAYLLPGSYSAAITATSSVNTVTVPVIMQVPESEVDLNANTGFQWIVLVDPATMETVQTVSADNDEGVYGFQFSGVPAGRYLLFAGSDANNDDFICDAGESCGSWPTLSAPGEVVVAGDVGGVNFVSSYGFNIGAAGLLPDRRGFSRTPAPFKQLGR